MSDGGHIIIGTDFSKGRDVGIVQLQSMAVGLIVDTAKGHRITDDVTRGAAADIRRAVKDVEKNLEDVRVSLVKPLNDHVDTINARFKPLRQQLKVAVDALDAEITRDRNAREAAAKAERERIEAEAEEQRKKNEAAQAERARAAADQAEADAKAAGMTAAEQKEVGGLFAQDVLAQPPAPVLYVAPPPMPAKTITSASGASVTSRKLWEFELRDIGALATAYPNTVAVRRQEVLDLLRCLEKDGASDGALEHAVPGIRAFKRDSVSG